ncbi:MAG: translocation/assembly module TamB domain-containing protein [Bryobacteraceae bacterium]
MTKLKKIIGILAVSLVALVFVGIIAAILVMRTDWFHNFVREKIIAVTEDSTGGKVELGSFDFDWSHLRATIHDFVIHGTEPAGSAPLLRAKLVEADLKILSGVKQMVDLQALKIDQPQAHVIVYPDGRTNVPEPKVKSKSDKSGLETVVDLAVGHFDVENGSIDFAAQKMSFSAKGDNLRAQLAYSSFPASYKGQLSMSPLYLSSGKNTPINLNVTLPVVLRKDRIELTDAKITTPESKVTVSGAMEHLVAPRISAHMNASLALDELRRAGDLPISLASGKDLPNIVDADIAVNMDENSIKISTARIALGQSNIEASGTLKDPSQNGTVQFNTTLALGELGRLLKVAARPEGTLQASGNAKLAGQSDYAMTASIHGKGLAFRQGQQRFSNIGVTGSLTADPHKIDLNNFKLAALGGEVTGDARLENVQQFHFKGNLHSFDIQTLARVAASERLPYSGVISGPLQASGDLKAKGTTGINAQARLAIAPGRRGVPVSGKLNADYNGAADTVQVANSYIALPNSRVDLNGSLNRQIQVHFVSRNLNDFQPALAMSSKGPPPTMPVVLRGGTANFDGAVTGKLDAPHIAGHLQVTRFELEDRPFDQFSADLDASPSGAKVQNGSLARGATQMQFTAAVGLHKWSAEPREPLSVNANIRDADLADLMAMAGEKDIPVTGTLNAVAQISGTVGNPRGNANLTVLNGTAYDDHFDRLLANVDFADQLVRLSQAELTAGTAKIDLNGTFQHPRESFSTGTIQAHLASNQVQLDQFQNIKKRRPDLAGLVQLNGDVTAKLSEVKGKSEFLVSSVNANASGRGIRMEGENLGNFTATAQTTGLTVNYRVNSDFAGSNIRVNGQTRLEGEYPTTATASISGLPVERVLAVAGRKDIPAKGILSANAQVSGTLDNPQGSGDLSLSKAVLYDEALDQLHARLTYASQLVDVPMLEVTAGPNRIDFSGSFNHPQGDFKNGSLRFHLASNQIHLAQLKALQKARPGLAGILQLNADATATLKAPEPSRDRQGAVPQLLFSNLDANVSATGIEMNKKRFGDLTAKAATQGQNLLFNLDSDFAKSAIHGSGHAQLSGDYPLSAQLNFSNVTYSALQPFLGPEGAGVRPTFDALAEGNVKIDGPALKADELTGHLQLSKLQLWTIPRTGPGVTTRRITIQNAGPIALTLNKSILNVQSAHLTGPSTDVNMTGSIVLRDPRPLNLQVNANTNLSLLQDFDRDIYSSGVVALNAGVRGSVARPIINGQMELKNASFNMVDLPNGLSNANGTIVFNGTSASVRNLTAESGGGKVTLSGFTGFGGGVLNYSLRGNAADVRVRYQGISLVSNAAVNLTGTSDRSVLSGTVTLNRLSFNPKSDFGSFLSKSAPPETAGAPSSGPLSGMKLDVRIRTATDVAVQTALAQNLQADADLTLRGTLDSPGMVGRVNVTSGRLIFFGTNYDVNDGSIAFYNPFKIDPILNVDLETKTQGVDVILNVSGPINNMKLTYRSDPPLQFNEIVGLLAAGQTPTSDPTILANQPAPPPQSLQQMGESAIVSQAVATPVADRLQRVFGVSKLKIDPAFTAGSALPTARLTLQQQVAQNITFTYITDLSQSNSQIIRVEWALSPQWSAVATRDENGRFGVDFFYKKQFR